MSKRSEHEAAPATKGKKPAKKKQVQQRNEFTGRYKRRDMRADH